MSRVTDIPVVQVCAREGALRKDVLSWRSSIPRVGDGMGG